MEDMILRILNLL